MNEEKVLRWIGTNDKRYNHQAYLFVLESLRYTQCLLKKRQHVSGQELLIGITRLAKEKYGSFALYVLTEWGILESKDFGNVVFNLVKMGEIKKTEEDSIEDFDMNFDLKKELEDLKV